MNWQNKLDYLLTLRNNPDNKDRFKIDVLPRTPKWQPVELEGIIKEYPWLPKSYLEYLKKYDETSIVYCRFLGSENNSNFSLQHAINETTEQGLTKNYFPLAYDPGGSLFVFDKKGMVYWWDIEDYEFEREPTLLANSFDDFMDECLMGKKYCDLLGSETDEMWQYYKEQGWA